MAARAKKVVAEVAVSSPEPVVHPHETLSRTDLSIQGFLDLLTKAPLWDIKIDEILGYMLYVFRDGGIIVYNGPKTAWLNQNPFLATTFILEVRRICELPDVARRRRFANPSNF